MRKFEEFKLEERKKITMLFANWLKDYTHEVIINVLEKRDEIINNDFAMNLLIELKELEEKENIDFNHYIGNLLSEYDIFKEYNPHNHPLTRSNSYRDVLYDMFIKTI